MIDIAFSNELEKLFLSVSDRDAPFYSILFSNWYYIAIEAKVRTFLKLSNSVIDYF